MSCSPGHCVRQRMPPAISGVQTWASALGRQLGGGRLARCDGGHCATAWEQQQWPPWQQRGAHAMLNDVRTNGRAWGSSIYNEILWTHSAVGTQS